MLSDTDCDQPLCGFSCVCFPFQQQHRWVLERGSPLESGLDQIQLLKCWSKSWQGLPGCAPGAARGCWGECGSSCWPGGLTGADFAEGQGMSHPAAPGCHLLQPWDRHVLERERSWRMSWPPAPFPYKFFSTHIPIFQAYFRQPALPVQPESSLPQSSGCHTKWAETCVLLCHPPNFWVPESWAALAFNNLKIVQLSLVELLSTE